MPPKGLKRPRPSCGNGTKVKVAMAERPDPVAPAGRVEASGVVISRRAADRLRAGHVWVYRSDVVEFPENAPRLVSVVDQRGILLGTALYSSVSEIPLRLISTDAIAGEGEWLEL